jgi:hypothetical protein
MKTTYPVLVVMALAVASLMWGMSGIGSLYTDDRMSEIQSGEDLEKTSENSSVHGYNASAGPNEGGNIFGLIISGAVRVSRIAGMVVLLPLELYTLGFPWWFAAPVGTLIELIVGIGILEFVTNREWT